VNAYIVTIEVQVYADTPEEAERDLYPAVDNGPIDGKSYRTSVAPGTL
jgi:hypothetical protein